VWHSCADECPQFSEAGDTADGPRCGPNPAMELPLARWQNMQQRRGQGDWGRRRSGLHRQSERPTEPPQHAAGEGHLFGRDLRLAAAADHQRLIRHLELDAHFEVRR